MVDRIESRTPSTRPGAAGALAAGLAGGLGLGAATLLFQGLLPGAWNQLANSGAVWSVGAFVAGAALPVRGWRAAATGTVTLIAAVVGYYGSATVFLDQDLSTTALVGPVVWTVVALVAGPVFGLAGAAWRGPHPVQRVVAAAALGAVFLAESGYLLAVLDYRAEAAILATIGLLCPPLLGRSNPQRLRGLLALVPLTLLGAAALLVVWLFTEFAFGREW